MTGSVVAEDLDYHFLTRELDRTKSEVFLGKSAAFLGSLMCSMNFQWDAGVKTAATDGVNLFWNPYWFLKLPPETRRTVLVHELWHVGRLHFVRMGSRNPLIWNFATDIRINNDLTDEGYSFVGVEKCWRDKSFSPGMPEEDIYDALIAMQSQPQGGSWGPTNPGSLPNGQPGLTGPDDAQGDLLPITKEQMAQSVNNAVRAVHQAKLGGIPGSMPGDVEELIKQFLTPVVPWEAVLQEFMNDLIEHSFSWKRPNRRYSTMYMPSNVMDEGLLEHLIYYEDVSGSISNADVIRFNSEVKYVHETFRPKKLTLVQFDTRITQETVFEEGDPFEEIKIVGRGGTSLVCVREHIIANRPTAAIIFSDLECAPIEKLPFDVPIIWVAIRAKGIKPPFGRITHIR